MKSHFIIRLAGTVALLLSILGNQAQACPIDYTSSLPQFGAASGGLASPIAGPSVCGGSPVSVSNSASSGGSWWSGTGYGDIGSISSDYAVHWEFGFWGYAVASMGSFYLGDLIITGGPASTIDFSVNVAYGGTAGDDFIPATQGLSWSVKLFDSSASLIDDYITSGDSYTPNGGVQTTSSGLLTGVPVGTAFSLEMNAQWYHEGPGFGSGLTTTGDMYIQFLASEVFNLPEGYTLSSASGGIVDNVWVSSVPLPAAVWLFGSGLLGLAGIARRKKSHNKLHLSH